MPAPAAAKAETFEPEVLLQVLSQVKAGDFTARMPLDWTGVAGQDRRRPQRRHQRQPGARHRARSASASVVGKEGKLSQRVSFKGTDQVWGDCIESVNSLIDDLVRPTNEMQRVIGAVADGDLSKKVSADVQRRDARAEEHDQRAWSTSSTGSSPR